MAHHVEPMDVDSDFDNKENSLHHNNVLPFTEKGYEELDVSELNMKLRYSTTPASSPMTKSCTADCLDNNTNKPRELSGGSIHVTVSENNNLTRSLNSTMTKNDSVIKSLKTLPLQGISTEKIVENSRSLLSLRPENATITQDITVTVSGTSDFDENMSLPSSSSSAVHTPEATTPTKDVPKSDGSPIMRGLKTVLNMFRSSQSPIPPTESDDVIKPDLLSPVEVSTNLNDSQSQAMLASTPLAAHRKKEASPTKRNSPNRDSIVFSDDLETELQWKDETTILFSRERIPIHKLLYPQPQVKKHIEEVLNTEVQVDMDSTTEYMDISYNDSIRDRTMTDTQANKTDCTIAGDSDSEFVDCETTFNKNSSVMPEDKDADKTPTINDPELITTPEVTKPSTNVSATRLKPIILNTTQDILDATLSITPEDLISQTLNNTAHGGQLETTNTDLNLTDVLATEIVKATVDKIESAKSNESLYTENVKTKELDVTSQANESVKASILNQTVDIISPSEQTVIQENPDVTQTSENIPVEAEISAQILDSMTIKDETLTPISVIDPVEQEAQKTEIKKTVENTTHATENIETTNSSPAPLNEAITKPLPIEDIKTSLTETLMTDLPVDIPLPDEDDIDNNVPDSAAVEVPTPSCLPLDLVDDIQFETESSEIVHKGPIEEVKLAKHVNNPVKDLSPAVVLPKTPLQVLDDKHNELECVQSGADLIKEVKQSDVTNDKPISDEPQNKDLDELPEVLPSLNTLVDKEQGDVQKAVEAFNVTNNVTDSNNCIATPNELNFNENHDVIPMDRNESIVELKPLPDIINQTMSNTENVDEIPFHEVAQVVDALPVPRGIEQQPSEVPYPEIVSDVASKDVPELISDVVTAPISEIANVTADISPTEVPSEASNEETVLPISKTHSIDTRAVLQNVPTEMQRNQTEVVEIETKTVPSEINELSEKDDVKATEEEIILSENDSPFVSVIAENVSEAKPVDTVEIKKFEDEFISKAKARTPPPSPPIASKGYNFNFDEIDDPFATKTNIRMSPPLDTPVKAENAKRTSKSVEKPSPKKEVSNRRKSQPERKRPVAHKRKFNSTLDSTVPENTTEKTPEKFASGDVILEPPTNVPLDTKNVTIDEDKIILENTQNVTEEILQSDLTVQQEDKIELVPAVEAVKSSESDTTLFKELKTTSSSEQSAYYSAGTSSSESIHTRNVFNLPEIDDLNFNPFATKSKMRQSPPPGSEGENSCEMNKDITNFSKPCIEEKSNETNLDTTHTVLTNDKIETEQIEKESFENLSNTTASSKSAEDKNATTRDINTEDEDTIEGPFLESEDLNSEAKLSDFEDENIDMMQFHDLPARKNEENVDSGELFIDAEAFEFLLNQNQSNTITDSGKESLFLKFDPLFAKRMSSVASDSVVAALGKLQKKQSTPTKAAAPPQKEVVSPIAGPSNMNVTQELDMNMSEDFNEDLNITVSKPMMVVPPAVNPVTPRNKTITPNRSNRRSFTFTSPAMAVIDRLLSLSGNSPLHETPVQVSREQTEADIALAQLRELLAEKEINVYTLRNESKELKERLTTLESHLKSLEVENKERLKKINELNDRLAEKTKMNKSMAAVVEEYERTIATLIAEKAQTEKRNAEEKIKLINERDEQIAHLASMEGSFNDLHSKYEKSKHILLNCKANEEAYMKSIASFEENLSKMQKNYELLKQHATSKLNHANQELEKMSKLHEVEILKLNAMIKRKELHIASLEESLAQKTKANEELTAIFDELINKVG
ncbi:unnamed protein product [Chrysodeixis includens]|uniref:Transforming acidic coiled-coil-containing protein C-terminal domain-containing protein n=1 Tax=Chrysodeixis includens TaxID=689277 RepID=A0A9N8Q053_CHRIL|nr:unnamed protein product [Chrysodeixis includens]